MHDPRAHAIGIAIENDILALYRPEQRIQPDWQEIWARCFSHHDMTFTEELGRRHLQRYWC
jgi:hypothetical protein